MKSIYIAILATLALTACGPRPTDSIYSDVQRDGTTITGSYSTAGFSSAEARSVVSNVCNGGVLASYGEQAVEGEVAIQFSCANGHPHGSNAGINFKRTGANTAALSAIWSDDNGNLVSSQGNVTF